MANAALSSYERIWAVVRRIPRGRVATYGQVAAHAGLARQPRLAGYAMHALPAGSNVPWHRVVAAGGRIALADADGHAALQRALLESEGIPFRGRRVDIDCCAWAPRPFKPARIAARSRPVRDRTAARRRPGTARG